MIPWKIKFRSFRFKVTAFVIQHFPHWIWEVKEEETNGIVFYRYRIWIRLIRFGTWKKP